METNKKQLIVFVNQTKFFGLLDEKLTMDNDQIAYLSDDNLIIKSNDELDSTSLQSFSIIIKPDNNIFNYNPQYPFKLLYHGETPDYTESNCLHNLMKDENCDGWTRQSENSNTLYSDIAMLINKKEGHKSFDDIYQSIPIINKKLMSALEFLHNSLGNNKNIPTLPDEFKDCKSEHNTFLHDSNNQNLRILRDAMLKEAGVV